MLRGDVVAFGDVETEEIDPQGTAQAALEGDGIRLHGAGWRLVKRLLDVVLSLTLILLTLPLMLLIALAITAESRGPLFFVHRRMGKGRVPFGLLKFRTMVPDAEERLEAHLAEHPEHLAEWRQYYKLRDDPRITRVGRLLRKSSLDELPQLFNILRGDMSVVGPRAIVRDEVPRFERYADTMLSVKPGLTGLWAVSGRNDVTQQHRAVLEYRYVTDWSLLLDLWILFRTIPAVIRGHGAY
ncbi:MAG TPA: sugar transferase [Actinomycetota bacterium]|nr:sugar transferase [Actinomycetota bacterium]